MSKADDLLKKHEEFLFEKAAKYCAYQPRCTNEVMTKLKQLGANEKSAYKIILSLKNEGFINDELFAEYFAVGKNRNNHWGKFRIIFELKRKGLTDDIINKALESIDHLEYNSILERLAEKKINSVKDDDKNIIFQKTMAYLVNKGFEKEMAYSVLNKLINNK